MKKLMTVLLCSVIGVSSLIVSAKPISAAVENTQVSPDTIEVLLNARKIKFPDAKPYIESSRVMVPIRFVSEALGADVKWDGGKKVAIVKDSTSVELTIGSMVATVNGKNITFDTTMKIKNQRTYVPLRFVSEALGQTVDWDGDWVWIGSKDVPTPLEAGMKAQSINTVVNLFANKPILLRTNQKEMFIVDESNLPLKIGKGYGERTIKNLILMKSGNDYGLKITHKGTPFNIFFLDQKVVRYRDRIRSMDTKDAQGNRAGFFKTTNERDYYDFGDKSYKQFTMDDAVYIVIDIDDERMLLIKNPF